MMKLVPFLNSFFGNVKVRNKVSEEKEGRAGLSDPVNQTCLAVGLSANLNFKTFFLFGKVAILPGEM